MGDLKISNLNEVQKRVVEIINSNLEENTQECITLESTFMDLGVNSITFIKIIVDLECEYNIEIDDELLILGVFPKVKSLTEHVELAIANA